MARFLLWPCINSSPINAFTWSHLICYLFQLPSAKRLTLLLYLLLKISPSRSARKHIRSQIEFGQFCLLVKILSWNSTKKSNVYIQLNISYLYHWFFIDHKSVVKFIENFLTLKLIGWKTITSLSQKKRVFITDSVVAENGGNSIKQNNWQNHN